MRIVSLIPSGTEIVCLLGLGDRLVGVSHECDYPPEARGKPVLIRPILDPEALASVEIDRRIAARLRAGESVYTLDPEALAAADPDLILTQELCDVCAVGYRDVAAAAERLPRRPEILSLDPRTLWDVVKDIQRVAAATGTTERARGPVSELRRRIERVSERAKEAETRPRVACLEWLNPLYNAGHWVPEMVELAGGVDVLGTKAVPSVTVAWEAVQAARPEVLILMPCGFEIPRTQKELACLTERPGFRDLPAVRAGRVWAVNGHAYYNRSGPRLVDGLEYLAQIIHPELFTWTAPLEAALHLDLAGGHG